MNFIENKNVSIDLIDNTPRDTYKTLCLYRLLNVFDFESLNQFNLNTMKVKFLTPRNLLPNLQ